MFINRLVSENFRNLQSPDLSLTQGFVVLAGPNGAGKTNFLESIYFGSALRKFPESRLPQLLATGQNFFRLQTEWCSREFAALDVVAELVGERLGVHLKRNGRKAARKAFLAENQVISFVPQDLGLLTRSPVTRRRYLDETLGLISAEYRLAHSRYEKALRQRNELWAKIQKNEASVDELLIWDQPLAEYGSQITGFRMGLFAYLSSEMPAMLSTLSPDVRDARFIYRNSGAPDREQFLAALSGMRTNELAHGTTLVGPHRDDFQTFLGSANAVGYISRGQMRAVVLALKLLEKKFIEDRMHLRPVMVLDDVFSEFDQVHQEKLILALQTLDQVFLTTTHPREIETFLPKAAQKFMVQSGCIEKYV